MYKDSYDQLDELGGGLRGRVQVSLVSAHGTAEAGIDGGGVFKEYMDVLVQDAFIEKDFFLETPHHLLKVNPAAPHKDLDFLGRVLAKAVYECILVEPQFSIPFLKKLLSKNNAIDDLGLEDEEMFENLMKLKGMSGEDIRGMGMAFEAT